MIKHNGSWYDSQQGYLLATKDRYSNADVPHGSPEAKRIIEQVKEREKRRTRKSCKDIMLAS
jgi:hypothetical protein